MPVLRQQEELLQQEACASQLEKARMQHWRLSTAKKLTKKIEWRHSSELLPFPAQPDVIRPLIYLHHVMDWPKVHSGVSADLYGNIQESFLTDPMQSRTCFLFLCFYILLLTFCLSFTFHTFIASVSHLFTRSSCVNLLAFHSSFHWWRFHSFLTFLVYLRTQFLTSQPAACSILSRFTWLVHSSAHLWMCSIHHSFFHFSPLFLGSVIYSVVHAAAHPFINSSF